LAAQEARPVSCNRRRASYTTATDANGLFSFQGFRGDALIIELKKGGYNFASDQNRFHYSPIDPDKKRFVPDRERPVLFGCGSQLGRSLD
jgi:hypothetical protein